MFHHIDIFPNHRSYYQGELTYFVINVLPFGLSTAPYCFTKVLKPVVRHWRGSGKKVCMFLKDGLGGAASNELASADAKDVYKDLTQLGFLLSDSKCKWEPSLVQTWLGHIFNMTENRLYITETRNLGQPYAVTAK